MTFESVDPSPFEVFTGEPVAIYLRERLSEYPGVSESAKVEFIKTVMDVMIVEIKAWMTSGKIPSENQMKDVRWPDGAWQMFKESHLPEWLKKRFPTRWHIETIVTQVSHHFVCPHLVTDSRSSHIQFMATGTPFAARINHSDRY